MKCYRCNEAVLSPVRLADGLPAKCCSQCSGVLLDLLTYRAWKEDYVGAQPTAFNPSDVQDGDSALQCRSCSKLMLRFRVAAEYSNYVDVCSTCDVAWLDGGEWELLEHLDAADKLTDIMSAPWQASLRRQQMASLTEADLQKNVGEEGIQTLKAFVDWYSALSDKSAVSRYLREHKVP